MPAVFLPHWIEYRRGGAPLLLIAPHGGRRPRLDVASLKPNLKSNDVHTGELTAILAQRLDATAIINHGMDRNSLDLNRVSQVRRDAPWFIELLAQELARLLESHSLVTVVFVHGWNTGRAKCDVGVGARGVPYAPVVEPGARLTMDRSRLAAFVESLALGQTAEVTVGERYPASHPNNLVQLFRARDDSSLDAEAQISAYAETGQAHAMQLELGVPLRWPGPWRDAFLDRLTGSLRELVDRQAGENPAPVPQLERSQANVVPLGLQGYDPARGLGLSAHVGAMGEVSMARLLLFLGGQRVALFTGEAPHRSEVTPLHVTRDADRIEVRFHGPMLLLEDAALYVDLENAMASSRLVSATVSATFDGVQASGQWRGMQYGQLRSSVTIEGSTRVLIAPAVSGIVPLRQAGSFVRTSLVGALDDGVHWTARGLASGEVVAEHVGPAGVAMLSDTKLEVVADDRLAAPRRFDWSGPGMETLRATPLTHMPIVRGLGKAGYLRVTFGIARVEWGGRNGHALYEHCEPI